MKPKHLIQELRIIRQQLLDASNRIDKLTAHVHPDYLRSAYNLLHYTLLRNSDLRKFHDELSELGTSSLRSSEGYVLHNMNRVIQLLELLYNVQPEHETLPPTLSFKTSKKLIKKHANLLFNEKKGRHFTEIMVTLPLDAAVDKSIIKEMALHGMEIARINLSHGTEEMWSRMVENVKQVSTELRRDLKIYMDLPGPKIRVGDISYQSKKGKEKDFIKVRKGEHIILTKRVSNGRPSVFNAHGAQEFVAEIPVSIPEIIDDVRVDDRVYFDDGTIKGTVINKTDTDLHVLLQRCTKNKIRSRKGINLPDSILSVGALTDQDIQNMRFICASADMIGYSFVSTPSDVQALYKQLNKHQAEKLGVIFKIENKSAFNNLPLILLEGMRRNKIGVMIARGDLAVELGFERISEVQNQILWFCEAAHIPVIWATQVLETLAKTGVPTRSEISDAALSAHAECVMLNKGPFINEAIDTLKNILIRMEGHSFKRKNAFRSLSVAQQAVKALDIIDVH